MNDKTAQYVKILKANTDRLIIAVMYALLFFLVWLWWSEQEGETQPESSKKAELVDAVAANPASKQVLEMTKPQSIEQHPQILQVSRFNMFDYKSVKEKDKIEKEAAQKITQAEAALREGRKEEAKRVLEEILKVIPAHQKAKSLMDELNAGGAPAPGQTPASGAPAGTPATPPPPAPTPQTP